MEEQQCFRGSLQQVHHVVTPTDMGQLVREKRLDLTRRQVAQDRDGQDEPT